MRTGEAADRLGVDRKTITNWLGNDAVRGMFSATARGENRTQRVLNDDDLAILATIHALRVRGVTEWADIRKHLETGKREPVPALDGITAQHEVVSRPYAEQGAKAAATVAERDAALARISELEAEIEQLKAEHKAEVTAMWERMLAMAEEIGRLKAQLDT